jgi:hypothetical protein
VGIKCICCQEEFPEEEFIKRTVVLRRCTACRQRLDKHRKSFNDGVPVNAVCARCGATSNTVYDLNGKVRKDIGEPMIKYKKMYMCPTCFMGDDDGLKVEDFVRQESSLAAPHEGRLCITGKT